LIPLTLGVAAAFAVLVIWNNTWVFWVLGLVYVFGGISVATDHRHRDRRFKNGYRDNAPDTSDPARGMLLILAGVGLCALAVSARKLVVDAKEILASLGAWRGRYGWLLALAVLVLLAVYAVIARIARASRRTAPAVQAFVGDGEPVLDPPSSTPPHPASGDVLRILLYVGKADGQLRAPERAVIADALLAIAATPNLTREAIGDLLSHTETPTQHAFKLAVGRLAKHEVAAQDLVLKAAEKILATQKTIQSNEKDALVYMRKRLSSSGDA
jgi:hypothetical protein